MRSYSGTVDSNVNEATLDAARMQARLGAFREQACSPRDISLRKDRIVYCSAVKSGRGAGAVGVDGGRIKSGRNDDIGGERERERGRGGRARNKVQERSAATFWR